MKDGVLKMYLCLLLCVCARAHHVCAYMSLCVPCKYSCLRRPEEGWGGPWHCVSPYWFSSLPSLSLEPCFLAPPHPLPALFRLNPTILHSSEKCGHYFGGAANTMNLTLIFTCGGTEAQDTSKGGAWMVEASYSVPSLLSTLQ